MLYLVLAQQGVSLVHVADNDCNVLEPAIVAARVNRKRPSPGSEELDELNVLIPQAQPHSSQPQTENAQETLVFLSRDFAVGDLFESQHARVEVDSLVHVAHRE